MLIFCFVCSIMFVVCLLAFSVMLFVNVIRAMRDRHYDEFDDKIYDLEVELEKKKNDND